MAVVTSRASGPATPRERFRSALEWRPGRYTAAFAAFTGLTLAWLSPMALRFTTHVLQGPSDATLSIWQYWAIDAEGATPWTSSRTYLNGAPEGLPLPAATNWAAPIQAAFVWALHPLLGFVGAFNLFLIAGFVLTGFFTFALLDRLGVHPLASFFGAYLVAFNPWAFERAFAGHAAFLHGWVFILLIAALLRVRARPTLGAAALAGGAFALTFLMASYFGLLASVIVAVYYVVHAVSVRGIAEKLWTVTLACVTGGIALLAVVPAAVRYVTEPAVVEESIRNGLVQIARLSASPAAYILPSRRNPFLGEITEGVAGSENFAEQSLYFGVTALSAAAVAVFLLLRRHDFATDPRRRFAIVFAAVLAPVAFWASLPRDLELFGLPLPSFSWFVTQVTTFYRVYARFGLIVAIAVALLAAAALDHLARRHRRGRLLVAGLTLVLALELLVWPITGWNARDAPPYVRVLQQLPRGTVANYPMLTDKIPAIHLAERAIYYQTIHGQPLYALFGSGVLGTREDAIRVLSRYVTQEQTPAILAAEGVRYVVLHDDVYRAQGEEPPTLPAKMFRLLAEVPDKRIYELRAAPVPDLDALVVARSAEIAAAEGWRPPRLVFDSGFYDVEPGGGRWLGQDGVLFADRMTRQTNRYVLTGTSFSNAIPRSLELVNSDGTTFGSTRVETFGQNFTIGPFTLLGRSARLRLRVTPEPQPFGGDDPRVASVYFTRLVLQPVVDVSNSLRTR